LHPNYSGKKPDRPWKHGAGLSIVNFKNFQRMHLLGLLVVDLVTGVLAFVVAFYVAKQINEVLQPFATWLPFNPYLKLAIIWTFLNSVIFSLGGLYSRRPWGNFAGEIGGLLTAISTSMVAAMAITFFFRDFDFSRLFFITAWIVAFVMFWITRGLLRVIRRRMFASGSGTRRLIIWGRNDVARSLLKVYMHEPWRGKSPVAIINGEDSDDLDSKLPVLVPDEGINWIGTGKCDEVIVARHDIEREFLYKLAQVCRTNEVALKLVPDLLDVVAGRLTVEGVEGIPMVEMGNNLGRYYPQLVKRIFDLIVGTLITILVSPILGICALLVMMSGPGPVLFSHMRLGKGKKLFPQFKFRTMVVNADEILKNDPELMQQFLQGFKLKDDPRVTPVGKFLRKYSLDELPQLFNVIRGEMSLVGPRPIVENEVEKYGPFADALFSVTPGMTGLWQVSGRSDVGYEERVKLDLLYIEQWTLWEDLRILMLTPGAVIAGRGSY